MKYTRITALAAICVAASLSLTACNGDDGSGSDASSKAPASSSSSGSSSSSSSSAGSSDSGSQSADGGGSTGSTTGNGKSGSGGGSKAGASNGGAKSGGKATFCKTQDLAIDATNASPDKTEGRINITMINRGSTTCSATGFAGVDIKDTDNTSNPIERGQAQPRVTTLKPGDAAVFDLAYTIDNSGHSLAHPTKIQVTPPNETHTLSLDWPSGAPGIKGAYTDVQVYPTHTTD
ncbi:DUF4232 domain-containing protein [Streptomyces sp. NPDC056670]|uniref:DUF4232 domain-containing protein n=1 Tax=unclassified Streptomyces TaxID=2593676 RepID=UPI00369BAC7D